MNDKDKRNLDFLMSVSKETLRDWYQTQATPDDIAYAMHLLLLAELELAVKDMEVAEMGECLDCTEAQQVLAKFTLKGTQK